ncbi:tol-pal system protein YbgF [Thauera sp. 2A1]|uniref:tol-pal system protein YbgF n=1 Tax=Thauera sp. 2A1 TaxID=2570191 RepID=UPI00129163E3|nr:tol-pal system protein YbgF [Thauera sp. 2A1]KAI5914142.1 tol-pal system protein YbgF [Thauera sp. 2A1]
MKRLLPLAALLAMSSVGPAQAGLFDDTEARRQIMDMRQELEGRIDTTSRGQLELANQNEQLRAEIARLRGQLEVLANEVENLGARQRDFYVDLDTRLRKLESTSSAAPAAQPGSPAANAPAGSVSAAAASADTGAESSDYEAALNLLKQGKNKEALGAFESFITRYPSGNFAPGAHFWAGNAALQTKDVASASKHFNFVLNKWPNDTTAPDAMLGLANSQQAMGDAKTAQRTLQQLVDRYPQSNAAKIAKQRLAAR